MYNYELMHDKLVNGLMAAVADKLDNDKPMSITEMALALIALDANAICEDVDGICNKMYEQ